MCTRRARITRKTRCRKGTWYDPTAGAWQSLAIRKTIRRRRYWRVWEVNVKLFLKQITLVSVLLFVSVPALSQAKRTQFNPDGSFWIIGQPPTGFSNFGGINLNAR